MKAHAHQMKAAVHAVVMELVLLARLRGISVNAQMDILEKPAK